MLRVRFGGFSALKITKGLKANWVDKASHFGGTVGLFTGVSYITLFEVINIIIISLGIPCKSKVKEVEAKKCPCKENEKTIEDMKKKFEALERRLIVHDYTLMEDNQNFEAYKTKLLEIVGKKMHTIDNKMDNKMKEVMEQLVEIKEKLMKGKE